MTRSSVDLAASTSPAPSRCWAVWSSSWTSDPIEAGWYATAMRIDPGGANRSGRRAVRERHDARGEGLDVPQHEAGVHILTPDHVVGRSDPGEDGVNPEAELVEQAVAHQRLRDRAVPVHQDVLPVVV